MNADTNWYDVLGNDVTAQQAMAQYEAERGEGETLAEWMQRTSEALWGEADSEVDWGRLADQLQRQAAE